MANPQFNNFINRYKSGDKKDIYLSIKLKKIFEDKKALLSLKKLSIDTFYPLKIDDLKSLSRQLPVYGKMSLSFPVLLQTSRNKSFLKEKQLKIIDKENTKLKLYPIETRITFKEKSLNKNAPSHKKNITHIVNTYLCLGEFLDSLFINLFIEIKKENNYTKSRVIKLNQKTIDNYYSYRNVLLSNLLNFVKYAGLKEAVFYVIIRRNYRFTYFISIRNFAPVCNCYCPYTNHKISKKVPIKGTQITN